MTTPSTKSKPLTPYTKTQHPHTQYTQIPATQLLLPASKDVYGSDVLFQNWAGLPFSTTLDAVSSIPGPEVCGFD